MKNDIVIATMQLGLEVWDLIKYQEVLQYKKRSRYWCEAGNEKGSQTHVFLSSIQNVIDEKNKHTDKGIAKQCKTHSDNAPLRANYPRGHPEVQISQRDSTVELYQQPAQ